MWNTGFVGRHDSIHWLQGSNSIVAAAEDYQVIQRIFFDITKNRMLEEQLRREPGNVSIGYGKQLGHYV